MDRRTFIAGAASVPAVAIPAVAMTDDELLDYHGKQIAEVLRRMSPGNWHFRKISSPHVESGVFELNAVMAFKKTT